MATYSVGLPDGRTLDIEAPDEATALRGAKEWHGANPKDAGPNAAGENRSGAVSALSGIPLLGAFVPQATAALNAVAQPYIGAPGMSQAPSYAERYAENLPRVQQGAKQFESEHPVASTAGQFATGAASMLPLGAVAPVAKALGMAGPTVSGMAVRGGLSGAGIGAADAALRGQDAATGAEIGAGLGIAGPVVGRIAGSAINAVRGTGKAASLPTGEVLKDVADAGYKAARATGVEIDPQAIRGLGQRIAGDLHAEGFRPSTAGGTFDALAEMQAGAPKGAVASIADIDNMRQVFRQEAGNFSNPKNQEAARRAINSIDDYVANIPARDVLRGDAAEASRLVTEARANYAAGKRSEKIDTSLGKADLNAAAANSGQNVDNATRQQFKAILNNPKQRAGFSADELAQMERVVRGTWPGDIARVGGNLLGGGGGLGAMLTGTIGAAGGAAALGPVGALVGAAPIAGVALKKIANASTARQARILDELVRSRAPASESANAARAQVEGTNLTSAGNAALIAALLREPVANAVDRKNLLRSLQR